MKIAFWSLLLLGITAAPVFSQTEAKIQKELVSEDEKSEADEEGFSPIFDGKTLEGWRAKEGFWRVEDGALTGQTTEEKPLESNTFIIWEKGKLKNFELKLKFRMTEGNSGIQYRSQDLGDNVVGGYQADMDFAKQWIGILYDERGRGILAERMQSVKLLPDEKKEVTALDASEEKFLQKYDPTQWNTYHVIADGNKLTHIVNGVTTIRVIDEQKEADQSGILALQLHTGPPMTIQFKDIRLKKLEE